MTSIRALVFFFFTPNMLFILLANVGMLTSLFNRKIRKVINIVFNNTSMLYFLYLLNI
jgi:hypothetical protein